MKTEMAVNDDVKQLMYEDIRVLLHDLVKDIYKESQKEDRLLSRNEASAVLGIKSQTLAVWAMEGKGPAPTKIGTKSMYQRSVLDEYISTNTMPR